MIRDPDKIPSEINDAYNIFRNSQVIQNPFGFVCPYGVAGNAGISNFIFKRGYRIVYLTMGLWICSKFGKQDLLNLPRVPIYGSEDLSDFKFKLMGYHYCMTNVYKFAKSRNLTGYIR